MKFKIKEARESAGYTQKELAAIIGVAPNTFHGYESGKHDPKSDYLQKIASACDVTVDFLLGITDAPNAKTPANGERDRYADIVVKVMSGLTEEEKQQIVDYAKLHEAARRSSKEPK